MKIYMDNKHKIALHNRKYKLGQVGYKLKMNKFGDMVSKKDFASKYIE